MVFFQTKSAARSFNCFTFELMITIIVGTNRTDAKSEEVAIQYRDILVGLGVETEMLSLQQLPDDYIRSALYENVGQNEAFNKVRDTMNSATKFLFVIPEYNGSFPGVLKAFIDGLDRAKALTGKKCALVGISAGDQGAGLALSHFTDILNYCGTNVLAYRLRLPNIGNAMTDNKISNTAYLEKMHKQAEQLIEF